MPRVLNDFYPPRYKAEYEQKFDQHQRTSALNFVFPLHMHFLNTEENAPVQGQELRNCYGKLF